MKRVLIITVAAAVAAGGTVYAEAEAEPSKVTGWLYAGLGYGSHDLAANAGVNVKYLRFLGTLRATFVATIQSGFLGPGEDYHDIGLLFGFYPFKSFSVAAGVARVGGERSYGFAGGRPSERIYAVGVPIEVQFTPIKGRVVGLGIVGYANINSEESFGGVTVGIELGKLK